MKILQINSVCGRGSTGRIATDLADILMAQGHDCRIAYGRDSVPDRYQNIAVRIGSDIDIKVHGAATRLLDTHGFASKRATAKFLKWVEEYDPDLIHLHNIHGYYIHVELLFDFLKRAGKPVIWTLHDCWPFTGHCAYFSAADCWRWQAGCAGPCPQKQNYPQSRGLDQCSRNYQRKKEAFTGLKNMTIVTPSQWLADLVKESFLSEYPVEVIPNGIDLNVFYPIESDIRKKYGLEHQTMILGVANIWDERKGLQDFIALSGMLTKQEKIVLVGLSQEQIETLPENVIGICRTNSPQELAELYAAADVFVNPTHEDNFPTTNLEALSCGTPVITYKTGGSPEAVDETCGIVTDCSSEALWSATKQAGFTKEACLQRAAQYDKNKRFMEYLRLYKSQWK